MSFWDFLKNLFVPPAPEVPGSQSSAAPPPPAAAPAPSRAPAPTPTPAKDKKDAPRSFRAPGILALSADEHRKRALKIKPWATPWIGRVDTIPPQSDERTALIDRGLILTGKLSEKEIDEIHQIGDLWLHFHGAVERANEAARIAADAALGDLEKERAARKAQKQRESAEKKARRREEIERARENDILFLGRGVSKKLGDRRANVEKLTAAGLPLLATPKDVADFLKITIPRLRWLAFHSNAVERTHYVTFEIPKRSGGVRLLSAPRSELKAIQRVILAQILEKVPVAAEAHGFTKQRSTVSNAEAHVKREILINVDVKDFFPTISFVRVRGIFMQLGYSPAVATIFSLLCTEALRVPVEFEGKTWLVATGERALPQGAPTSPALSNLACRRLDRRLAGLARKAGWSYTRYADDITFSSPIGKRDGVPWIVRQIEAILDKEGFTAHPKKRRIQRKGRRQEVTGIGVNVKLGLPRKEVKRLRAILHAAKKSGLAAQNREARPNFEAWLRGKLAYLAMVDPRRGKKMLAELDALPPGSN